MIEPQSRKRLIQLPGPRTSAIMGCNSPTARVLLMTIPIRCPHCDKSYNLKDELKGKRVACTNPIATAVSVSTMTWFLCE